MNLPKAILIALSLFGTDALGDGRERTTGQPQLHELLTQTKQWLLAGENRQALQRLEPICSPGKKPMQIEDVDSIECLIQLGTAKWSLLQYAEAESVFLYALEALDQNHRPMIDQQRADLLANLGISLKKQGKYVQAEKNYFQSLSIRKQLPNSPKLLKSYHLLMILYNDTGRFEDQRKISLEAMKTADHLSSATELERADIMNGVGLMFLEFKQPEMAEPLFLKSLDLRRKNLAADHLNIAESIHNLGQVRLELGDYDNAKNLYLSSLDIKKQKFSPGNPKLYTSMFGLIVCYWRSGLYDKSEKLLHQIIIETKDGADPASQTVLSVALNNLGTIYYDLKRYGEAESKLQAALSVKRKIWNDEHPKVRASYRWLALVACKQGNRPLAEQYWKNGEPIQLGDTASTEDRGSYLYDRAMCYAEFGDDQAYLRFMWESLDVMDKSLRILQSSFSEASLTTALDKRMEAGELLRNTLKTPSPEALELTMAWLLLSKGRAALASEQLSHSIHATRDPSVVRLYEQWRNVQRELSTVELHSPIAGIIGSAFPSQSQNLSERAANLQNELTRKVGILQAAQTLPSPRAIVAAVARSLPQNALLVEYVKYETAILPAGASATTQHGRYVALLLHPSGRIEINDLGPAEPIDQLAINFVTQAADRATLSLKASSGALFDKLIRPISQSLAAYPLLVIAPDDQLNLIPFEALQGPAGYLVDRAQVSYVSSGRDLIDLVPDRLRSHDMVVFAAPDFVQQGAPMQSSALAQNGSPRDGSRDRRFQLGEIDPLPGARQEALALKSLQPNAKLFLGPDATESTFLAQHAPGILHVATHGLFTADTKTSVDGRGAYVEEAPPPRNPLLRSALILAGAQTLNQRPFDPLRLDEPDGIVTALELSSMNLWGTQLVVLSACSTGRGATRRGQGVYGLRRAVLTAGAETLVTSLWKVDDAITQKLMVEYYKQLYSGRGRAESLRTAALVIRKQHPDPHDWAPFISIGKIGPLQLAQKTH